MPPKQGNFRFLSLEKFGPSRRTRLGDEKLCFFPNYTLDISLISFQGNDLDNPLNGKHRSAGRAQYALEVNLRELQGHK